jgi:hypothetical protein
MSEQAIDRAVSERLRNEQSLYRVDEQLLRALTPDLILTQDLCQVCAPLYRDGGHAMSLIRNRRGFLGALFSALLALALFDHGTATAQEVKQIKLTEKQIQSFMAAYEDIAKVYDGAESDKPDPKVEAQAAAVAKKHGFASLAQYDDVSMNITMIMAKQPPPR